MTLFLVNALLVYLFVGFGFALGHIATSMRIGSTYYQGLETLAYLITVLKLAAKWPYLLWRSASEGNAHQAWKLLQGDAEGDEAIRVVVSSDQSSVPVSFPAWAASQAEEILLEAEEGMPLPIPRSSVSLVVKRIPAPLNELRAELTLSSKHKDVMEGIKKALLAEGDNGV